jgi:hypothetical protein
VACRETRHFLLCMVSDTMDGLPDRTAVQAEDHLGIWVIVGGVRYKPRDLVALGDFGCAEPVAISEEDLARIPERPPNGTVVIQDRDPTIYVIRDGLRFGLPSPEEFDAAGLANNRVRSLPAGSLDVFPYAGKWPPRAYYLITTRWGRRLLRRTHSGRFRSFARWAGNQATGFVLGVVAGVIATLIVTYFAHSR